MFQLEHYKILGLKHSQNNLALMAPFYQGYFGDTIYLQTDDILGLQEIYGSNLTMFSVDKREIFKYKRTSAFY